MLGLDAPRMLAVNPMFISVCGLQHNYVWSSTDNDDASLDHNPALLCLHTTLALQLD
jgi:hypothetical protein